MGRISQMSWENIEQVIKEERAEEGHRKRSRCDPIGSAAETDVIRLEGS
jgi:hypothetical protein